MDFPQLLDEFCGAFAAGDGPRFGRLFTADAVYHDVFYGPQEGPDAIGRMLEDRAHRDGTNYHWEMLDPVSNGGTGYARWIFSFDGKTAKSADRRVVMEGVGLFELRDGRIARYEDLARTGEVLVRLGFPADKLYAIAARWAREQETRPEIRVHVDR
jgi:ketosteroid isomerase-like protein